MTDSLALGGGLTVKGLGTTKAFIATLAGLAEEASIKAQNNLAYHIRLGEQDQMRSDIDRPKPWSLKTVIYDKATTTNSARVFLADPFKPKFGAGVNEEDYLGVQILSGERTRTRGSERAFIRRGWMNPDQTWVPARGVKIDKYGNFAGMSAIMQNLGFIAQKRKRKTPVKAKYFIVPYTGIYQVVKGVQTPVLWFVKRPTYSARYDFYGRADREFNQRWRAELEKQVDLALASG